MSQLSAKVNMFMIARIIVNEICSDFNFCDALKSFTRSYSSYLSINQESAKRFVAHPAIKKFKQLVVRPLSLAC